MTGTLASCISVVDARGRFVATIGLLLAFLVSILEVLGAGVVAVSIQFATAQSSDAVSVPLIGDVASLLPGSTRSEDLRWIAIFGASFFVARGMSVIALQYLTFRSSFSLSMRLTDRVMKEFLERDYAWHLSQNSAELSSVAIGVCQFFANKVYTPVQLAGAQALTILSLSVVAVAVEPVGAIVAMAAIGLVVAGSLFATRKQLSARSDIELNELAVGQRLTTESFQAIREVKLLDLGQSIRSRIWESRRRWARAMRQSATIVAAPRTVIETVAFTSLITLVAFRGQTEDPSALAGIGVLGYAVVRILPTANNLVTHVNTIRSGQAATDRLASILRETGNTEVVAPPTPRDECLSSDPDPVRLPLRGREIRFSYPTGEEVLAGIDITIEAGASVGLVGRTGCGKSTLLDVLAGLVVPTSGELLLGEQPLEAVRDLWWRSIGIVPQTITLLDTSLAENVALGSDPDDIDPVALERALLLSSLDSVVSELPAGVDTKVGERGVRLSGGQRQRVALARALYRDPPIIFLDEGTSALDAATEQEVIKGLRADRADRTLVMVAHRMTTLVACDEILLLDAGRIQARGTYTELLGSSPSFRRLAATDLHAHDRRSGDSERFE